jgi:hypothetical protein
MPKIAAELAAEKCRKVGQASRPTRSGRRRGVLLQAGNGGAASWLIRVMVNGTRRDIGLEYEERVEVECLASRATPAVRDRAVANDPNGVHGSRWSSLTLTTCRRPESTQWRRSAFSKEPIHFR